MKRLTNQNGFTIIDLLVGMTLFTIVSVSALGSVLAFVSAGEKAAAGNRSMENLNFVLESMSREIRVGRMYNCSSSPNSSSVNDCSGGTRLGFVSTDGDYFIYSYDSGSSKLTRSINGSTVDMTGGGISIDSFAFDVDGTDNFLDDGDIEQPNVIIRITGTAGRKANLEKTFNIQSTITQRFIDI